MKIRLHEPIKLMGGSQIGYPMQGNTQTFVTLGAFDTELEAINAQKSLQDFTANSDIDWSGSVREIDRQSALADLDEPPKPRAERELERSIAAKILGHDVALGKMRRTKFFRLMADLMRLAQFTDVEKQAERFCEEADANDLDWTVSVAEIDAQLYRKYGFSKAMIDFVEGRYSYDGAGRLEGE